MSRQLQQFICFSSLGIVGLGAVAVFLIFYPANMSPDSIGQYGQALSYEFDDIHPPIMAIVLSLIIRLGGNIGVLTLVQSIFGCFGVFYLSFLVAKTQRLNGCVACIVAACVFILLISPISPLSVYLTTFWKDTWTLILFLWIISFSIHLILVKDSDKFCFVFLLLLLILTMGTVLIVRHNTIVMAPLFIIYIFLFLRKKKHFSFKKSFVICFVPLLVFFLSSMALNSYFHVKKMDMSRQVVVLDLIGMVVLNETLCNDLTFTCEHLMETYRDKYVFGFNGPILYHKPSIIKSGYWNNKEELVREYKKAVIQFPTDLIRVKIRAFMGLIDHRRTIHWFYAGIHKFQYKRITDRTYWLQQNEKLSGVRELLVGTLRKVEHHSLLRWVSAVHLVWITINLFFTALLAVWYLYSRSVSKLLFFLLSLFPLAYYFSYLLATVEFSFRFMYPSTLVAQVCIVTLIGSLIYRGIKVISPVGRCNDSQSPQEK